MKKVLSILLVIAMAATLFAGCGETTPTPSTDASQNPSASASAAPTSNEPTKDPKTSWKSSWKEGDALVAVNVYDTTNYLSQWNVGTKIWMAKYGLKLGTIIAPVLKDQISINKYELLKTESGRTSYTAAISNLFLSADTTPDVMPALYATNTGTGAIFKGMIGKKYLLDLAPFIEEGGALENYVKWVWEDTYGDVSYWENVKDALVADDGALYALPRLEYMPVKRLVSFNMDALADMVSDMPTTLSELETLLAAWVAEGYTGFAFNAEWLTIDSIITPIANMYGIDYDSSFDWKEMNGEPMFSYYYPEYLEVLKTVNKWAKNGWITTSKDNSTSIAMCEDLTSEDGLDWSKAAELASNALAVYGETWHDYLLADNVSWQTATISAAGYTAAVSGGSALDYSYFAITKRSITGDTKDGYDTILRLMAYMNDTMTMDGYIKAKFGEEGIPFADSWEESGNYVWVERDGKKYIRMTDGNDRFDMKDEDLTKEDWNAGKHFFRRLHPLYTWLFDACNGFCRGDGPWRDNYGFDKTVDDVELVQNKDGSFDFDVFDFTYESWVTPGMSDKEEVPDDMSEWQWYANKASASVDDGGYGITDFVYGNYKEGTTKFWARSGRSGGIDWFADVSAFPMQYTIYCFNEGQYTYYPIYDEIEKTVNYEGSNTLIYSGFFPEASEVLSGTEANDMQLKMESIKLIAKNFTIDFISGKKGESDWAAYIKSLKDAGIEDVYEFYKANAYVFNTKHKDGTRSMSDVIAKNRA